MGANTSESKAEYQRLRRQQCQNDPDCYGSFKQGFSNRRQTRREEGKCIHCSAPAAPNHTLCFVHLAKGRMAGWLRKCMAVEILGGKCAMCGQTDVRILEFDHRNNDGKQHREELGGKRGTVGVVIVTWVLNNPTEAKERLQVLCACCHAYKRYERSIL